MIAGSWLFKEEQSAARTVREQQEKRSRGWPRQPLKIEQLPLAGKKNAAYRTREHLEGHEAEKLIESAAGRTAA